MPMNALGGRLGRCQILSGIGQEEVMNFPMPCACDCKDLAMNVVNLHRL